MFKLRTTLIIAVALTGASCGGEGSKNSPLPLPNPTPTLAPTPTPTPTPTPIASVAQSPAIATFTNPWAVKVIPDGRLLITQRSIPV